jgi:segregation and condensation protein B
VSELTDPAWDQTEATVGVGQSAVATASDRSSADEPRVEGSPPDEPVLDWSTSAETDAEKSALAEPAADGLTVEDRGQPDSVGVDRELEGLSADVAESVKAQVELTDSGEDNPELAESVESVPPALAALSDPIRLRAAVEAILFVVESPVSAEQLATVVQRPTAEVVTALAELAASYDDGPRGIEIRQIADGFRVYTRPELTGVVEAFLLEGQRTKLSQAALETLAVIAYRQPVTRGRISAIRGVNVDGVVRTLSSRGLIIEDGADPDTGPRTCSWKRWDFGPWTNFRLWLHCYLR